MAVLIAAPVLAIVGVVLLLSIREHGDRVGPTSIDGSSLLAFPRSDTVSAFARSGVVTAMPVAPASAASDVLDRCGLPSVPRPAAEDAAAQAALASAMERDVEPRVRQILDGMIASGSPRTRAAGLYLDAARVPRGRAVCETAAACPSAAVGEPVPAENLAQLVRLASVSDDPVIYGWALRACEHSANTHPGCGMVSVDQWARLDPGNGAIWLKVAEAAGRRGDGQAVDAAMHRIAGAATYDEHFAAISGIVLGQPDAATLAGYVLVVEGIGYDAAVALPSLQSGNAYCADTRLRDANRRETCQRIARTLITRGRTLITQYIGVALGRKAGLSSEELDPAEQRRLAYGRAIGRMESAFTSDQPYACASIRKDMDHIRAAARDGEIATLEARLAASGSTVAELAQEAKTLREQAQREAATASASTPGATPR